MFGKACSKRVSSHTADVCAIDRCDLFRDGCVGLGNGGTSEPSDLRELPEVLRATLSATLGLNDPAYHVEQTGERLPGGEPAQRFKANWSEGGLAIQAGKVNWELRLEGWGYGEETDAGRPCRPTGE